MPTPPQPPRADSAALAPYPLLSFVSYNHDILKLRLSRLHVDFLYNYKLYTERTVDDNRRAEFTRGHSIHVPGFDLDTYPVRRVWAQLFDAKRDVFEEGKEEVKADEDDEERAVVERAKQHYATSVAEQPVARARRVPQLGLPHHLFRSEQERIEDERNEKEQTEQRLARKRARRERWRNEIKAAVERALRKKEPEAPMDVSKEEVVEMNGEEGVQPSADAATWPQQQTPAQSAATRFEPAASSSPSPITPARTSSPTTTNRSPSPTTFTPATYASSPATVTSSAIPSLCEECGSRIDSMWSQCDFCGFDPLLSEGEEEEGGGRRRKKRGRAARMEKLMAQTALQEKKAKSQQEMNKLMETMSPWETA